MDTITHALAGYVIAKTGLTGDTGKWGVAAGVVASVFPDVDGLLGPFFGTEFTLMYHRGITNSLFLVVPFSLFFAWLFEKTSGKKRYWTFFLIWLVEMLVHTFLDLLTSYGTMILSPLSWERFALDWVFIIDLFLTGIFLLFLLAMQIWRSESKLLARLSVVLASLYILLCAGNHFWALSLAKSYASEHSLKAKNIASVPQPLSPFHWANYIVTQDTIHRGLVNLVGKHERTANSESGLLSKVWAQYQPTQVLSYKAWHMFDKSSWVGRAMVLEGVKMFMWFARFPVVRYEGSRNGQHRVTFFDLRFDSIQGRRPFSYEVIFNPKGEIVLQGFHRNYSEQKSLTQSR